MPAGASCCRGNTFLDQLGQLAGGFHSRLLPGLDDDRGDSSGEFLLPVFEENPRQLRFRPFIHNLPGCQRGGLVHPHVQLRLLMIAEAPLRIIQLGRGNTQIQQNAVHLGHTVSRQRNPRLLQSLPDIAEIRFHQCDPGAEGQQLLTGKSQRRIILVQTDQPALRSQLGGDPLAVARPAQGAIHIDAVGPYGKPLHSLFLQNGNMMKQVRKPPVLCPCLKVKINQRFRNLIK
ncbi:hypothetical protein D3C75_850350 [compost metagenome]